MKQKHLAPGRFIAMGFAAVIILGSLLLFLPIAHQDGIHVSFIDALFTSTSAVCVTGLATVDPGDTLSVLGRTVLALLIQIGGLGITSIGVGLIILSGKKINMRARILAKEALNYHSFKGILALVKHVILMTLCFELSGMLLSLIVFAQDYPFWDAVGISAFHSISAFNNAGFDILGNMQSLTNYSDNILLNLTTCGLVIFGGLGFFVIVEMIEKRAFHKFSLHTKIVLSTTGVLLVAGTLLLKTTENITWLGAFFNSTVARTAGFATFPLNTFTNAGLFILIILMFIGASPSSTGGGIKTTTFFVLIKAIWSTSTNSYPQAFRRKLPQDLLYKAYTIAVLGIAVVVCSTLFLCIFEPQMPFLNLLFEVVSAFGTVGLSTGITPDLSMGSKIILILTMFIGRVGPLTIASLWIFKPTSDIYYADETVTVG